MLQLCDTARDPSLVLRATIKDIFLRNPYTRHRPDRLSLIVTVRLEAASPSNPILILLTDVPVQPDKATCGHDLLHPGERNGLLVPEIQMHGQGDLSGPSP